jgi:hypothetical protein
VYNFSSRRQDDLIWTLPFCCITFTFFTLAVRSVLAPARFIAVCLSELTGATAAGIALWLEHKK